MDRKQGASIEDKKEFIGHYLRVLHKIDDINKVDKNEIEIMLNGTEYGCMLSSLWWGIWGVIESTRMEPDGWDYLEYGQTRLKDYFTLAQRKKVTEQK